MDEPEALDEERLSERRRLARGLSMRAIVPNAITAAALCAGLTGIRFAMAGDFEKSVQAVILAGLLDGIDGRAARLLKAQTRFGAELDSLADSISFGVAPALIIYLWTLHQLPSLGWIAALAFAICCVLRLARFNARLDMLDQPHKQAGFLTGVPAPLGAGLAFLPMYLWIATGIPEWADYPPRWWAIALGALTFVLAMWMFRRSHKELGRNWSITLEIRDQHSLVSGGPYALVRHPMYTSFLLMGVGQAFLLANWIAGPVGLIGFAVLFLLRVDKEERMMAESFGQEYLAYMKRTRRLIPYLY